MARTRCFCYHFAVAVSFGFSFSCCEIDFPMTLIYNLWNRFKIREIYDLFYFSFRRNVGYNPSEIFSTNRVLRFVFVFLTVRGGVSTKTKKRTRFVFVFVGRLGLASFGNVKNGHSLFSVATSNIFT